MKRYLRWMLCALLAGLSVFWILFASGTPENLVHAHPNDATLFTVHEQIASRYPELINNPLAKSVLASAGFSPSDVEAYLKTEGHRLIRWLLSGEITLAYKPIDDSGMPEVWSFTDSLGYLTAPTRLLVHLGLFSGVEFWTTYNTFQIYRLKLSDTALNGFFTFCFVEEGIIGCISENPRAIYALIRHYAVRDSRLGSVYNQLHNNPETAKAPDKGWAMTSTQPCSFAFTAISSNRIAGMLHVSRSSASSAHPLPELSSTALQWLGDAPVGLFSTTAETAVDIFRSLLPLPAHPFIQYFMELFSPTGVFAAILDERYFGRYLGMKLPVLVIGLELHDDFGNATNLLNRFIDELNARRQLGLILETVDTDGLTTVYSVEGTSGNFYSQLPVNERIACAVAPHLVLISNSADTLGLLMDQKISAPLMANSKAKFTPTVATGTTARLWFDLNGGGKALRLALTAYGVKLLDAHPQDSHAVWQNINEFKAWIEAMGPMQTLQIDQQSNANSVTYRFISGPYP